ncbi:DMT family transporter [Amycolatopsis palatopharyngis]|uniref:DMT family transporter n=1 Tax=Amycolatopsis palatopharyngis TaxID=187982 RepID=UPI000E261E78|nr:DMT family transporter [Amycolatopsis palatopharyngis]
MSFAVVCAVLAALCSAIGAQLQHSGVRAETQDRGLRLRTLAKLVRNRDWIRGFAVLFACAVLQILALTFAPVSLVAPIVVLALPMVALLNAHSGAGSIDRAGWVAIAATSLAVGVFVAVSAGAVAEVRIPPGAVLTSGIVVGAVGLVLGVVALASRGNIRCVALATAAGAGYGLVSVLLRDVTYTTRIEGFSGLPPLSAVGVAVAFLAGSWLIQLGYDSGPADVVVGSQTVVNPLVATVIGMTLLDETTSLGAGATAVLIACGVVAMAGVLVLARHHPDASARKVQRAPALS